MSWHLESGKKLLFGYTPLRSLLFPNEGPELSLDRFPFGRFDHHLFIGPLLSDHRRSKFLSPILSRMESATKLYIALFVLGCIFKTSEGLRCYTCSVDFRSEAFSINNTCIFPKDHDDLAHCSSNSKFCKGVVTRVGGVFVMLQRSCSTDCAEACTEKGYGVRIKDCVSCCKNEPDCGTTQLLRKK
ncbi:uncharacterized protein NPIL_617221 [Nephila pilipes]|uniref:Uncharacterized protein n=1 Tax=Nephila pilipes TaxID=299642 RepID=A0A8X6PAA3_NEPPI|nr:uncharacterized protein NPIL_617221 [Nephila pilipes]